MNAGACPEAELLEMFTQLYAEEKDYIARAREVFIRLGLLAILCVSCAVLLRPFVNLLVTAVIIAIAVFPAYQLLTRSLRGRKNLAAVLFTVLLLVALLVPSVLLAGTLTDGIRDIAHQLQTGRLKIPPPPDSLDKAPLIGARVKQYWALCSTNASEAVSRLAPHIRERVPSILSASADMGSLVFQLLVSILVAGYLLATSEKESRFADRVFVRIFGRQGNEYKQLIASTIRSVANGILGVAVIQTLFASLGFWFVGLPGAGLWAVVFLIASVLQVGPLVLVPAVVYGFAIFPTSHAVMFLVWCALVGLMDNVLKPVLLGRGGKVPIGVVFLGVLGGFIVMRLVGLFVGAIILSVGYKLFIAWLDGGTTTAGRAEMSGANVSTRAAG